MLYWIGKIVQSTENEKVYAFIPTYLQKTIIIHDCYNACNHLHPWPSNASESSQLFCYHRVAFSLALIAIYVYKAHLMCEKLIKCRLNPENLYQPHHPRHQWCWCPQDEEGFQSVLYWWSLCPLVFWISDLPCRSCCCFHVNICEVVIDYNSAGNSVGSSLHCA